MSGCFKLKSFICFFNCFSGRVGVIVCCRLGVVVSWWDKNIVVVGGIFVGAFRCV